MTRKYTIEKIREIFQRAGCKLLEDKYISYETPMSYICTCLSESKISLSSFLRGSRCSKCGHKKTAEKKKIYSQEIVEKIFKKAGCKLLDKFINTDIPLSYICQCRKIAAKPILLHNFIKGVRCKECGNKKSSNKQKLSYKYIKKYFEENGCKLLSPENKHKNSKSHLVFRCHCGKITERTFDHFSKSPNCQECGNKKISEKKRLSYEYIKKYFEEKKCQLLTLHSDYRNSRFRLLFKCYCGTIAKKNFNKFFRNPYCQKCGIEKIKGKNSVHYNPNKTDEERVKGRLFPGVREWRKNVYIRDSYTCQYCDKYSGKIYAHHIESWARNKELRTIVSNGITFCEKCHLKFHKLYSWDSTREKVEEFLKTRIKQSSSLLNN